MQKYYNTFWHIHLFKKCAVLQILSLLIVRDLVSFGISKLRIKWKAFWFLLIKIPKTVGFGMNTCWFSVPLVCRMGWLYTRRCISLPTRRSNTPSKSLFIYINVRILFPNERKIFSRTFINIWPFNYAITFRIVFTNKPI